MTTTPETPVTVEQIDRETFKHLLPIYSGSSAAKAEIHGYIDAGEFDADDKMLAIARHRLEATRELAAEVKRLKAEPDESFYCDCGSCGEPGCGCTHKCKYAFNHPDVEKHIEYLDSQLAAARRLLKDSQTLSVRMEMPAPWHNDVRAFLSRTDSVEPSSDALQLPNTSVQNLHESQDGWQPIETAPKDGTAILAKLDYSDLPHTIRFFDGEWLIAWDGYPLTSHSDRPTHWMPLPAAPQRKGPEDA